MVVDNAAATVDGRDISDKSFHDVAAAPQLQSRAFRSRFQGGRDLALANGILERGMIAFGLVCVGHREIADGFIELVA